LVIIRGFKIVDVIIPFDAIYSDIQQGKDFSLLYSVQTGPGAHPIS
jgi:hypothetical protein